jgi:MFS family permease
MVGFGMDVALGLGHEAGETGQDLVRVNLPPLRATSRRASRPARALLSLAEPRTGLKRSVVAVTDVLRTRDLRSLELSWACSTTAEAAYLVALAIFAYEQGGAVGVGLVGLLRLLPAAAVAPFAALLGDRYRRRRLLLAVEAVRAAALAGAALAFSLRAPAASIYAIAVLVGIASTLVRPSQGALLPWLARTPQELVAANMASATIEGAGFIVGPIVGGLLASATTPGTAFAVSGGSYALSWFMLLQIPAQAETLRRQEQKGTVMASVLSGFGELRREGGARLVVGLFAAQTLVRGALNVLIVAAALGSLHMGKSGVGLLMGAIGVGGMVGALAGLGLVGRRLALPFGLGLLLWGLPLVAVGGWPQAASALVFLAALGAGNSILDVSGLTLLQRVVRDQALTRVLGVLEGLVWAMVGLGSVLVLPLVAELGTRGAFVVTGSFLPLLAVVFWPRLRALDHQTVIPGPELALLDGVPLFAPLSVAATEQVAGSLIPLTLAAGTEIIREGEPGERFYLIEAGQLEVTRGGKHVSTRRAGEYVGEIALLRDVPRTATVTARTDVTLYALERDDFLRALTGHAGSREAGEQVVEQRLTNIARVEASDP